MENDNAIAKGRKEKIRTWLKDPFNLTLVIILIFAIIIRFYYFNLTKLQPLWWDEAAYGSLAKNFIYHTWDGTSIILGETSIRPPLFPIFWSILIRIGIGEVGIRFLLELIPSVLSVFFIFLIIKETYNKTAALISAFIFSVLWIHLFYTGRLLTHVLSLAFLFMSIYFFIKANKTEKFGYKYFAISLFLAGIVTLLRYPDGLIYVVYALFLVFTRFSLIKDKKVWLMALFGLSPILIFFLYNYFTFGNIFPALLGGDYAKPVSKAIAFNVLSFIPVYLKTPFFIFFILGIILALFELLVGYDLVKKNTMLRGHLIFILILFVIYSYFIFYIKGAEDRWLFPASISLVFFAGLGLDYAYKFIKKFNKQIANLLILVILIFGAYSQVKYADDLIKDRKQSFLQIRQGFEWIKDNTQEESVILGAGIEVYSIYYAERRYESFPEKMSDMEKVKADFLVAHAFTPQPDYISDYLQSQNKWQPIQLFFLDQSQQQPALIIFKRI